MSEYSAPKAASTTLVQPVERSYRDDHVLDWFARPGLGDRDREGRQAHVDWRIPSDDSWSSGQEVGPRLEGSSSGEVGLGVGTRVMARSWLLDHMMTISALVVSITVGVIASWR